MLEFKQIKHGTLRPPGRGGKSLRRSRPQNRSCPHAEIFFSRQRFWGERTVAIACHFEESAINSRVPAALTQKSHANQSIYFPSCQWGRGSSKGQDLWTRDRCASDGHLSAKLGNLFLHAFGTSEICREIQGGRG
jgi:hypothetical protein